MTLLKKRSVGDLVIAIFIAMGLLFILIVILRVISLFFFPWYVVETNSMTPTIHKRDYFFSNKYYYKFFDLKRGDIVVIVPDPDYSNADWTHRVIGLSGDHIVIKDEHITVNGVSPEYPYIRGAEDDEFIVPEGSVFQKGDDPDTLYGQIKESEIIGKVVLHF